MKELPNQYELNFDNNINKPEINSSNLNEDIHLSALEKKDENENEKEDENKIIDLSEEDLLKLKDESPTEYYALMEAISNQEELKHNDKMNDFAEVSKNEEIKELKKLLDEIYKKDPDNEEPYWQK